MTKPAVIQGSLVNAHNVNTHKCVRLAIDVPVEYAAKIMEAFGWPTQANPVPVAVARLGAVSETETPPAEPSKPKGGKLAKMAGILCNEGAFATFLREFHGFAVDDSKNSDDCAEVLREICGVTSRAELDSNDTAAIKFHNLKSQYEAWLKV